MRFWIWGKDKGDPPFRETVENNDYKKTFRPVHASELDCIQKRRERLSASRAPSDPKAPIEWPALDGEAPMVNTVGLALSGGGIRSAAFCLGALQGLDAVPTPVTGEVRSATDTRLTALDRVDYLSTVSGGGYIGASMSTAMAINGGTFPFRSLLDQEETPSVQHIRDNSNYLFPRDSKLATIAIYLRGLLVNLFLIAPWLALAAVVVVGYLNVLRCLQWSLYAPPLALAVVGGGMLIFWGLWRSCAGEADASDVRQPVARRLGQFLLGTVVVAFVALSAGLIEVMKTTTNIDWNLAALAATLAPLSGILGFVAPRIAEFLDKSRANPTMSASLARFSGIAVIWAAAAIVPILLWIAVLLFGRLIAGHEWSLLWFYVAICIAAALMGLLFNSNANSLHRLYRDRLSAAFLFDPRPPVPGAAAAPRARAHRRRSRQEQQGLAAADGFQLHEDLPNPPDQGSGDPPGGLTVDRGPYHIINAAVNLQHSRFANNRGRNADFFFFSRNFTGSQSTGYVNTKKLAELVPTLDLGTAMAVSGAAFSSNMGASSIKPLTPTLALLNIRLGYWLLNPRNFGLAGWNKKVISSSRSFVDLYFLKEAFGLLHENLANIYVSDGGHIDNLGIYELLRRRCRLIVAIDGEADASLDFNSLIAMERHARIDLGVRIDLPWRAIRAAAESAANGGQRGPHVAVGRIIYPRGQEDGVLVYIKSSLTGDENDIIRDYKRRRPKFPHETTLDQLFSEEQFEVYRSLGFHVAHGFLSGKDRVTVATKPQSAVVTGVPPDPPAPDAPELVLPSICADNDLLKVVRKLLGCP